MGQTEVYEYLKSQSKRQPDKWHSVAEIKEALAKRGCSDGSCNQTHSHLLKLAAFGMVQMKGEGLVRHRKLFRAFKS